MNIPATISLPAKASGNLLNSKSPEMPGTGEQSLDEKGFSGLVEAPLHDPSDVNEDNFLNLDVSDQLTIDPLLEDASDQEHEELTVSPIPYAADTELDLLAEAMPLPLHQNSSDKEAAERLLDMDKEQNDLVAGQEKIILDGAETLLAHQVQWAPMRKDTAVSAKVDVLQADSPFSFASTKNASNFMSPINSNNGQAMATLLAENKLSEVAKSVSQNFGTEQKISMAVDEFSQLSVVKKENHISFLQPSTPNQLAGVISKATSEVRSTNTVDISMSGALDTSNKPVTQLKIQLLPRNLGLVEVSMQRQDGAISIQISTETAEAERLIARENNSIKESLRSVGLFLSDIKVQTVVFSDRDYGMKLDGMSSEYSDLQQNSQSPNQEKANDSRFIEKYSQLDQPGSPQVSDEELKGNSMTDDLYF